jgi:hypothetical protein
MKRLFDACHNYATAKDGGYFKKLREEQFWTQEGLASRFIINEEDWRPSAATIDDIENGKFHAWSFDHSLMMIRAMEPIVFSWHKVNDFPDVPPEMLEAKEKEVGEKCKLLGFKFDKYSRGKHGWRYRITDSVTKLHYSADSLPFVVAAVEAAMRDCPDLKFIEPKQEKKVEIFDPFDL